MANGVVNTGDFEPNPNGVSIALDLDIAPGARPVVDSQDGDVEIRAVHGTTDAPAVDISVSGVPIVTDATFRDITGYGGAPAQEITLEVAPSNFQGVVAEFAVDLAPFADLPFTVIASGFLDPSAQTAQPAAPLTVIAIAPDGSVINLGPDLIVNEFLASPGTLDANNDGTADAGDQFVEVRNISTVQPVDLTGYTITNGGGSTYIFPTSAPTLAPGEGAVVFAGGTPNGFEVFVDTGLPALDGDTGDTITLADASGTAQQVVSFVGTQQAPSATTESNVPQQIGESTARNGVGTFVPHTNINGNASSPGADNVSSTPLPVELAGFTAVTEGQDVVLTWRTLSETNNSGFDVQQRLDGAYQTIGFRAGQGTTDSATDYRFRIATLEPGTHTFRLRQIDLDGSAVLSEPVEARVELTETYAFTSAAPNPVTSQSVVSLQVNQPQPVTVAVYDVLGRQVATLHNGPMAANTPHAFTVDASTLSSGTYLIRAQGASFSATQRLVVVR